MSIQKIDYETARMFANDKMLILKPYYEYYGYFVNDELASICGMEYRKKYTRVHCNYSAPEHRNKGYITKMVTVLTENLPGIINANCLETSVNIYKKLGFEITGTKIYRGQTAYKMVKGM